MHPVALAVFCWVTKTEASENMNTLLMGIALFFYIATI